MRSGKLLSVFLVLVLIFTALPAAEADGLPPAADLPRNGEYVVRIDGGYVSEHTETVNDLECLRVDLFLDGVTNERLLSSISFKLLYPADQLTFVKLKSLNGSMSYANTSEPGLIQFAYVSTNGASLNGNTPLMTIWFTVTEGLPSDTQIRFAFSEPIKADSVAKGNYTSEKRTVGARLKPFALAPVWGDVNCDCEVTAADAALLLRVLVGLDTLSATGEANAKVDGKAKISPEDAALILRHVIGLIERFPVQE